MDVKRRRRQLGLVRPSPALENEYRAKILSLVEEMENSVIYWLRAAYRKNTPEITTVFASAETTSQPGRSEGDAHYARDHAGDARAYVGAHSGDTGAPRVLGHDAPTPAHQLARAIRRLQGYWQRRFDKMAKQLADYFSQSVYRRSDTALLKILREGGIAVRFTITPAMRDALASIVYENVSLIRSIPRQALSQVEGYVMRSVQTGRDLQQLTNDIQGHFAVTKNRARLIARDQNNKATGALQRVRMLDNGITECIWVHSGAGKQPRPAHVKAGRDRVKFDLKTGWYDPHEKKYIIPGELINCRCVMRPVVPGFS
jgi:uncharacterized protein with gpF-like domain